MSNPSVSVIIPAYNCQDTISRTVKSVLAQTFGDFEIVIVNDGSTDETAKVISSIKDNRIVSIQQDHAERSVARNNGIIRSRGRLIAFIDSDDYWVPKKLEKQLLLLKERPDISLVYADLYYFDDQSGKILYKYSENVKLYRGEVRISRLLKNCFIQSPTPVVRRNIFENIGLFDTELPPVEDWDMWIRIAANFHIDYVNEPLAFYRYRKDHDSWINPRDSFYYSRIKMFNKIESSNFLKSLNDKRILKFKRALAHHKFGYAKLRNREAILARRYFTLSIKSYPFYPMAYYHYLQTYMVNNSYSL